MEEARYCMGRRLVSVWWRRIIAERVSNPRASIMMTFRHIEYRIRRCLNHSCFWRRLRRSLRLCRHQTFAATMSSTSSADSATKRDLKKLMHAFPNLNLVSALAHSIQFSLHPSLLFPFTFTRTCRGAWEWKMLALRNKRGRFCPFLNFRLLCPTL